MLQEAKDLQQRAVAELLKKAEESKKTITFRAPTGSGKTRMMADFMNHVLGAHKDVIFLVSTLSKGNLAQQNYNVFHDCAEQGIFPEIDAHLISTEVSGEETLFIPEDHNVYVLPRDLFKKNGRLMQGPMLNFLRTMTEDYFGNGKRKRILMQFLTTSLNAYSISRPRRNLVAAKCLMYRLQTMKPYRQNSSNV